jgi:uncharacterized protein (TIGR00661 family)
MAKVLVGALSWGLGHATRTLCIVRDLLARGHAIAIVACGRALDLFKRECPGCEFIYLEDYPPPYTKGSLFWLKFASYIPRMLRSLERERVASLRIVEEGRFNMVLSDNRYDIFHPDVPSFLITHQPRFKFPMFLRPMEFVGEMFTWAHMRNFTRVIVPDAPDPVKNLAGSLAHQLRLLKPPVAYYCGLLSSVSRMDVPEDLDCFITISGPEPQRTEFEKIILEQVGQLDDGRKQIVITLGKPETHEVRRMGRNITVHGHLDRAKQQEMMNRAKMIVSRSGYTTVMELVELGKNALFVPTPGQTEQVYLSDYYEQIGTFHSVSQYTIQLAEDIAVAHTYPGYPAMSKTAENVRRLYEELFAEHLDGA